MFRFEDNERFDAYVPLIVYGRESFTRKPPHGAAVEFVRPYNILVSAMSNFVFKYIVFW